MGGDHGPGVTVPGTLAALQAESDLHVVLVGLSEPITRLLNDAPADLRSRITPLVSADGLVSGDERVLLFNCANGNKYPLPDRSKKLKLQGAEPGSL